MMIHTETFGGGLLVVSIGHTARMFFLFIKCKTIKRPMPDNPDSKDRRKTTFFFFCRLFRDA